MLTKLNGTQFILNCDLIETIYENPDTTIHLTTGAIYIVKEPLMEVRRLTIEYHKDVYHNLLELGQRSSNTEKPETFEEDL